MEWHFACINNRWTKRALASAGFGYPNVEDDEGPFKRWKPVFSVAEIGGSHSAASAAEYFENERQQRRQRREDIEVGRTKSAVSGDAIAHDGESSISSEEFSKDLGMSKVYSRPKTTSRTLVVQGLNRPLFHIDLTSALQSAVTNVERRGEPEAKGVGTKDT